MRDNFYDPLRTREKTEVRSLNFRNLAAFEFWDYFTDYLASF